MHKLDAKDHHLITIFADTEDGKINQLVKSLIADKDTRILQPKTEEALLEAAQHSSLIIIGLENEQDPNIWYAQKLRESRMVVADVIAVILNDNKVNSLTLMAKGFDICLSLKDCNDRGFKKVLRNRTETGSRRISGAILEEEYRRFSAALSSAPTSVIVFDHDKRVVFVSEHYYRAYPKSASRLMRGISVYDAFEMMSEEEQITKESKLYENMRQFWYSLNGDIEFTLEDGVSYRLKAVPLPNQRGTIVTAQNITEYVRQNKELKSALKRLKQAEKQTV